jgi:hypothetical protein
MKLTSLIGSNSSPYLEYAWVPANPSVAAQTITANILNLLQIDTEVADTDGNGSVAPATSIVTLNAGTYLYQVSTSATMGPGTDAVLSLFNYTLGTYISRKRFSGPPAQASASFSGSTTFDGGHPGTVSGTAKLYQGADLSMSGQFKLSGSQGLVIYLLSSIALTIGDAISSTTAGADQRTTLQLWKLA